MKKKIKIRFFAGDIRWPIPDGISRRQHAILVGLAARGEVDMLCHSNQRPMLEVPPGLERLCRRCVVQPNPLSTSPVFPSSELKYPMTALTSVWGRKRSNVPSEAAAILNGHYDITWIARISNLWRYRMAGEPGCIVDIDDLKHREYDRHTFSTSFSFMHRLARIALCNVWKKIELDALTRSDKLIVCSQLDRDFLNHPNIAVVHNAVPIPTECSFHAGKPGRIIFIGNLKFRPNVDGLKFFVDEIFPLIKQSCGDAHLHIIGIHPSARVRRLGDGKSIRVIESPPEVGSHLMEGAISIAPLRMGCGTRIKIIESLAHKTPVVATRVGAEGLDLLNERHILIADRPETFADGCIKLLRNDRIRREMAGAGHDRVRDRYSHDFTTRQVGKIIDDLLCNLKSTHA